MIKVLIILIVLVLSGIFAYLTLTNNKRGSSTTLAPGPSSKSEKGKDEPEPEPAPAKEDPGTCELSGDWAMSDECNADGTAIFTQAYKESKPGACPEDEKARVKPCCYQKGDWKDITPCDQGGRKTQEQTNINCSSELKTRRVDCPYVGEWKKVGECNANGKQTYTRIVVNSDEPVGKEENCCYVGPWGGWGGWSGCNRGTSTRRRTRPVVNCPSGTSGTETNSRHCHWYENKSTSWIPAGGPKEYSSGGRNNLDCGNNSAMTAFSFQRSGNSIRNNYTCVRHPTNLNGGRRGGESPHNASGPKKGRNSMRYVDRHDVNCGGGLISRWKLDQWSRSMSLRYNCLNRGHAGGCSTHYTGTFGKQDNTANWTGASVRCPGGKALQYWKYETDKIKYVCCNIP